MTESCKTCKFSDKDDGVDTGLVCTWYPPATLAAALGFKSQYDFEPSRVPVHQDWSCPCYQEDEKW